jgi:hypothetical protein
MEELNTKNRLIIENQHLLISLKSDMEQDIPFYLIRY